MNTYFTWETVSLLYPELLLLALGVCTYVLGAFNNERNWFNGFLMLGLGLCGYLLYGQDSLYHVFDANEISVEISNGPVLIDAMGHFARWVVLTVGALLLLMMWKASSEDYATEYAGSLMLILAGLMIVSRAGEIVLMFLGLELVSIPTYIMLFIGRRRRPSHEATAKYFYLSIFSSAFLLYGFAFLYGISGETQFRLIRPVLAGEIDGASLLKFAPVVLVMLFLGVGFKLAAVPFHFYAPDVYQGTTAANAGLLAVAPKIAGLMALMRILMTSFAVSPLMELAWQIAFVLAILSMTLGNVMALLQKNVRRMMAYSSIAHAGYILIGVAVAAAVASQKLSIASSSVNAVSLSTIQVLSNSMSGTAAALFYLIVYAFGTIGVFAGLAYLSGRENEVEQVSDLAGIGRTRPLVALAMTVCLFSLLGMPPLAGFWGKLALFKGGLSFDANLVPPNFRTWFIVLVVIGAINAAISAGYYLRIVGVMYFAEEKKRAHCSGGYGALVAATLAALLVLAIGIFPRPLMDRLRSAGETPDVLQEDVILQVANAPQDKNSL